MISDNEEKNSSFAEYGMKTKRNVFQDVSIKNQSDVEEKFLSTNLSLQSQ
jgi:hypothetical protein